MTKKTKQPNWVRTSEQLPAEGEEVLGYWLDSGQTIVTTWCNDFVISEHKGNFYDVAWLDLRQDMSLAQPDYWMAIPARPGR